MYRKPTTKLNSLSLGHKTKVQGQDVSVISEWKLGHCEEPMGNGQHCPEPIPHIAAPPSD